MKPKLVISIFFLSTGLYLQAQDNHTDSTANKYDQNTQFTIPITNLKNIPQELIDVTGKTVYVEAFNKEEFEHHDPSNIIKYNGLYYVYYTEHPKKTTGWNSGAYIRCATSKDGIEWRDIGIAVAPGEPGSIDDKASITAYVVPYNDKYYLFYSALGALGQHPGITYAEADTPNGPWKKSYKKLIWPSGNENDWDGRHNDDANIIYFNDKWYLYYKGAKIGQKELAHQIGVAISEHLTGPYKKYDKNPVFTGHAFTTWVHRDGVASFGFQTSWSKDGLHFKTASTYAPGTVGVYCPENFGNGENPNGIHWGLVVMKPKGRSRYLKRIEFPLGIKNN